MRIQLVAAIKVDVDRWVQIVNFDIDATKGLKWKLIYVEQDYAAVASRFMEK